jgi:hypothetical protein
MITTLSLMVQNPGRWFGIRLAELRALVANAEHAAIYEIAKERSFALLASWQEGKMYCRIVQPDGREQFFETTSDGGFIRSQRVDWSNLPVQ